MTPHAETYGATRLAEHARALAAAHSIVVPRRPGWLKRRTRGPLLSRLDGTARALVIARDTLATASASGEGVSPAGAWLLDNFFIVLEQVPEIRATLPPGYYQELPKLTGTGRLSGYPRIFSIVTEMIAHTDGRLDEDSVALVIRAYQEVAPLTLGELWAIPAMLRLGYLENVRGMAVRAARDVADRALATSWVSRLLGTGPLDDAAAALAEFVHHGPELTPAFLTRFLQQVRTRRSDFTPLLWLERWVAEDVMTVEDAAQRSVHHAALTQLVMSNSIASLRAVTTVDWMAFVEAASSTEAVLRGDPSGTYVHMTRATRDHYRHAIERIAREADLEETDVARAAIDAAAQSAALNGIEVRESHIGYHLIGDGRPALEGTVGRRAPMGARAREFIEAHPAHFYFGSFGVVLAATLGAFLSPLPSDMSGTVGALWLTYAVLLALLPAADVALAIVHQLVPLLVPPDRMPRLDYSEVVPERDRTVVIVPLLIGSIEAVVHAVEHLEVQYLANCDPELRFALLTDLTDAPTEIAPTDAAIVAAAVEGIRVLNATYGDAPPFYLLHRPRRWNSADEVWMGWERKRGKLVDFNELVGGATTDAFSVTEGDLPWLRGVRYVITLDDDTVLPRGAAAALIGTMAHPLNRAEFDAREGRVVRGYGILQPRVNVSLASASESRFAAIYSGHPGVDPYTTAVSDVYQDLFGEGTFTGKGIYDVAVFRSATAGRFPVNTLLSHDLIEGTFARAGLVTDIEVYDDYPTRYLTATRRTHRWIRGDWQLLRWLGGRAPGAPGAVGNPLSPLSRWKIADNMRRSITPIALLTWLVAGWLLLPGSAAAWTAIVLVAMGGPWIIPLLFSAVRPPRGQAWRPFYAALGHDAGRALQQLGVALVVLPDQAFLAIDAITRSIVRVLFTRRKLLEWQTASQVEGSTGESRGYVWHRMWPAALLGAAIAGIVVLRWALGTDHPFAHPLALVAGTGWILAWLLAPELAKRLGEPLTRRSLVLDDAQRTTALRYALRHWRYFDRFVSADTHWLVPDNFQETPEPVVASRTSPTNIGLQLLSTMSACDLGFITRTEMLERLERAFDSMDRMSRTHGHFYNWYDLSDLRVLDPPYVSTVDSGNLAGHLVALAQGCLAVADSAVDDERHWTVLDANSVAASARSARADRVQVAPWIGERIIAYQSATLELRRRSSAPDATTDDRASALWARQRLEAVATELASFGLEPEDDASMPLRTAALTSPSAAELIIRLDALAERAKVFAMAMDFQLVYDPRRRLLAIGYNARSGELDESAYDLLASESRQTSFIAVAKGDAPLEHWFRLGRSLTIVDSAPALVSWSGSMFEYLMPLLVMPPRPFSLLDQTCHAAVHRQIRYGQARGVPWGISESAYNVRDRHETYQYHAFGVPDLALKRGLSSDLVVAPYASVLATGVDAHASFRNLAELEQIGALGAFGFYDAVDYTRPPENSQYAVVRSFMAHHIGMSLVALDNALSISRGNAEGIWQQRFMNDPSVRAAALLLDERVPRRYVPRAPQSDMADDDPTIARVASARIPVHEVNTPHSVEPHVALLGGPRYSVLLTNSGSGHSRADGLDVMRWRADAAQDDSGQWIYVKDVTAGTQWSTTYQPTRVTPTAYRASFATDRVTFFRRDAAVETHTEVVVIAAEQAEVRRVTLVNRSRVARVFEITSYGEVVLSTDAADRAHAAFQKLFVETEWVPGTTLLASRRPRSAEDARLWCVHVVATGDERVGDVTFETDRAQFIGRGRTVHSPRALDADVALSGTSGAVLDPVLALRVRIRIEPERSATLAFTTAVAPTREAALRLADRYRETSTVQRAMTLARTEAEVELRDLDILPSDVALYQELAGALMYPHEALRTNPAERNAATAGQQVLWAQGISGDWPIVLATIRDPSGLTSVRQLLVAHQYWRSKGIRSDLIILNTRPHSYAQELQDQLVAMAMSSIAGGGLERPGGVFIRRANMLEPEQAALLQAIARVHIKCDGVGLGAIVAANVVSHAKRATSDAPRAVLAPVPRVQGATNDTSRVREEFANGYGALDAANNYVIGVAGAHVPPAPWANVVANPSVGFCITERGASCTWVGNSYFYRLTPWFNDPVSDPFGEVLYLRDADRGVVWTPTPGPSAAEGSDMPGYSVTHAPGRTSFAHVRDGIETELVVAVPSSDAVKISRLTITNHDTSVRRLSLTSYVEWVLGAEREQTRHMLHTQRDADSGALFAQNHFAPDFTANIAFSWMSEAVESFSARRDRFVGRHGDLAAPAAMRDERLSGVVGAGYDACAALRSAIISLAPGESRTIVVLLGAAGSDTEARALIARNGDIAKAESAIADATRAWDERLSVITVRTPDPEFDALVNRWSLYQSLACRMWARSALYQSSGAFGFRDQLQDCMAFVYAEPAVARAHIVVAAGRQFPEGDVQHWWHEPSGRGVRTRFSDDLAWLPFVTDHYVRVTGDVSIWDASAPYLRMRQLAPGEHEVYDVAVAGDERGTLYEHCVRALDRACTSGAHGLPLMGGGDWNDGMNRVGAEGHGESVWLAWFLIATLRRFAEHADLRTDHGVATRLRAQADAYAAAAELTAWDGAWYRRAFFDDGAPLGTAADDECQIDAIAQSWSVISGAGDPARARTAMQSVNARLVRDDLRILLLLTPPFDHTTRDPGYIKGYVPGVRENGAQYTHAALWTVLAMTALGDGDRASELMSMVNPFSHARTREDVERYKVEPYVVAADVYAVAGHEGRGGWTWYTGAAAWTYRVGLEGILGFEKRGSTLRINPCIPAAWSTCSIVYRFGSSAYTIDINNANSLANGERVVTVDGVTVEYGVIALVDDGAPHAVVVTISPSLRRDAE